MRIGIMGGTFDPIHNGHIKCAEEVQKSICLDKILFIPTGKPPHKISRRISPAEDRLNMVAVAIECYDDFFVSDIEIRRQKYTYTYDTITELKAEYPQDDFYMIIGADTLADIVNWHRKNELFEICNFVAVKRPGVDYDMFEQYLAKAKMEGANILPLCISETDVSSTEIRKNIKEGKDICGLVPDCVREYILDNDLYKVKHMSYDEIADDMKGLLSKERYEHCLNVAKECVRLGKIYGISEEKCRIAGLLHDVAKELTEKQYYWLGLRFDDNDYEGKKVICHAAAGKILANRLYGIEDAEILEAIECHVTGKPGMCLLAMLVFIADYTEKGRIGAQYDSVRSIADSGKLEEAALLECDNTLIYNLKRGGVCICTETVKTRNWILSIIQRKNNQGGEHNG